MLDKTLQRDELHQTNKRTILTSADCFVFNPKIYPARGNDFEVYKPKICENIFSRVVDVLTVAALHACVITFSAESWSISYSNTRPNTGSITYSNPRSNTLA